MVTNRGDIGDDLSRRASDKSPSVTTPPRKRPKVYSQIRRDRLRRAALRLRDQAVICAVVAAVLFPILALGAMSADMPIHFFDGLSDRASLKPSSWLTWSDFWFGTSMFAMVLMTRRYGARIVTQGHAFAWLLLLIASFAMIALLAPQLTQEDLPRGSYVLGVAVSWYVGPVAAIHLYDLLRGGRWWKAPLFGGLAGMLTQTAVFFLIAYSGTQTPWGMWWIADLLLKTGVVVGFIGIYSWLRKRLVPLPHLGGR